MLTVFYGNQVYGRYPDWWTLRQADLPNEVLQGCYIYVSGIKHRNWYKYDQTPVLIADVPPALQAWVLLLEDG